MKIILDTHYVIRLLDDPQDGFAEPGYLEQAQQDGALVASVVSLWEADIKFRMGKLPLTAGVKIWPKLLQQAEVPLLPITDAHILAEIGPEPAHKDPFDRLLLGIARAENGMLLTDDRALRTHPLAWKPMSS